MSDKIKPAQQPTRQTALIEGLTEMAAEYKAFTAADRVRRKKISRNLSLLKDAPVEIKLLALALANPFSEVRDMARRAEVIAKYLQGIR